MALEAALQVAYLPLAGDAAKWPGVLGIATFDSAPAPSLATTSIPVAEVHTPVLGTGPEICEVWRTEHEAASGQRGRIRYRHGEGVLFGSISVTEEEVARHEGDGDMPSLYIATEQVYGEIFETLDELGYPHLLRIWNYLPQINLDTHGLERYRQFNSARRKALRAFGRHLAGSVPAACALGSASGSPLVVYFLASHHAPIAIENPRQISAYEYPSQYGPRPVFSRASVLEDKTGAILFISGTASIVGHRSVHAGDVGAQTRETLANLEALLAEANRVSGARHFDLKRLAYKVYVRNDSDLPIIQSHLRSALGSRAQIMYLQADICRQELLVEIEAIGRAQANIAA